MPNNNLLESDDNDENSEDEEMGEMKSSHELRTQRLQKKIKEIEADAVKEKKWQMTGKLLFNRFLEITRRYPIRRYILGVLTHTSAWHRN